MRRAEGGGHEGRLPLSISTSLGTAVREALSRLRPASRRLRHPAVALAAFLVGLGIVLALDLGDDGGDGALPLPTLESSFIDPELGIMVRYPEGWKADRESGAVRVRRRDRTAMVSIVPAARARKADDVLRASVAEIRARYRPLEGLGRQTLTISGKPARARTFLATSEDGTRLRVLIAAVEGERRAYLLNAFSAEGADFQLLEIEQILESLRLSK